MVAPVARNIGVGVFGGVRLEDEILKKGSNATDSSTIVMSALKPTSDALLLGAMLHM